MSCLDATGVGHVLRYGGYELRSAFQPIFSFSHRRLIGHEALLRATDQRGRAVAPQRLFAQCANDRELRELDHACCRLHAHGFARGADRAQWLFLNVDASSFDPQRGSLGSTAPLLDIAGGASLLPSQIVIELLEAALPDGPAFEDWTIELKRLGFIVALDDFGAGHSNFDRVFRLRPHVVKLDRSVIARAAVNPTVRRVLAQMISLLHECGSQVLIEGVESVDEANVALDSDADFVQGYHFARPQPTVRKAHERNKEIFDVWDSCDERSRRESQAHAKRVKPYAQALMQASELLQADRPMEEACAAFLRLDDADICYLLDADGLVVDDKVLHKARPPSSGMGDPLLPLLDVRGARWSRRPYFRTALAAPGELQVTRPRPMMHSRRMSVTLSVCFTLGGAKRVICGDKLWHAADDRFDLAAVPVLARSVMSR